MFERYTEGARRTIFFARYEAANLGFSAIDTEHLLLGILREDRVLIRQVLPGSDYESVRAEIAGTSILSKASLSVDLPLTEDSKLALKYAMQEADRLREKHIGTEHLLLGLMRDQNFASSKLLSQKGASLDPLRKKVEAMPKQTTVHGSIRTFVRAPLPAPTLIEVHGQKRSLDAIRASAVRLKEHAFYWERKPWKARDVVYEKNGRRFSFDTSLAADAEKFLLVQGGWKREHCGICRWELFETDDPEHGFGFTNGHLWICDECHRRFIAGDYFSSSYLDMT